MVRVATILSLLDYGGLSALPGQRCANATRLGWRPRATASMTALQLKCSKALKMRNLIMDILILMISS
ncbi:hypothetical protein VI26_14945 [Chromobacterium sp. LK1]|nr:hypothetical protein VI26_14945 [Chromobacterium sp. LK1]